MMMRLNDIAVVSGCLDRFAALLSSELDNTLIDDKHVDTNKQDIIAQHGAAAIGGDLGLLIGPGGFNPQR